MKTPLRRSARAISRCLPWNGFGGDPWTLLGHPYYLARSGLRKEIKVASDGAPEGPLLDVGCGEMPYRRLFKANAPYECLEIDQPRNTGKDHVTYLYNGSDFPLLDEQYAVVFSSQTLEHSFSPERMLSEIFRVLRPGGRLVLAVPFLWPEHEQPFDSQRFTSYGLVSRLESSGFIVQKVIKINPGITAIIQLLIESIERPLRYLRKSNKLVFVKRVIMELIRLLLVVPYLLMNLFGLAARAIPRREDAKELFLDLVVVADKPSMS